VSGGYILALGRACEARLDRIVRAQRAVRNAGGWALCT
jgi:hypothetical protein